MTPSVFAEYLREISRRKFAKFLREISRRKKRSARTYAKSRGVFRKFAFENFRSRSKREKKKLFSWADLYLAARPIMLLRFGVKSYKEIIAF